jgi:hypothetical protein
MPVGSRERRLLLEQRLGPRNTWIVNREMTEDGRTAIRDGTGDGRVSTDCLVRRRERLTLGVSDVDGRILGIGPVELPVALSDQETHRAARRTCPYLVAAGYSPY